MLTFFGQSPTMMENKTESGIFMLSFRNDYSEGAHPKIMQALMQTNLDCTVGYGCDEYCKKAADIIKKRFACENAAVHFMVGGTITNLTVISAILRPWEAVIAVSTGHIAVHETGAIEASGHKVYVVNSPDGKLTPTMIRDAVTQHCDGKDEHMVMPKMVYISDATELGTIYTKAELTQLSQTCRELGLYLFLDGARMAMALTCDENDLKPEDFAKLCDVFYIGGTKDGLLFGEAVVIANEQLAPCFRHAMKQRGGMLAKGRLLGVQFAAFFEEELWLQMGRHAVLQAKKITAAMKEKGYSLYADSVVNMVFPVFSDAQMQKLSESFDFEVIAKPDPAHTAVRFVTSWATSDEKVESLIAAL